MNKLYLIIEREFRSRIRMRSFWVMSLLFPILMLGIGATPIWLSKAGKEPQEIIVLDATGQYAPLFQSDETYRFISGDKPLDSYKTEGGSSTPAILAITDDLSVHPEAVQLFSHQQLPLGLERMLSARLSEYVTQQRIASYHIPELREAIAKTQAHIQVRTYRWDEIEPADGGGDEGGEELSAAGNQLSQGGRETKSEVLSIVGIVLTFLSYLFIMTYGGMVLQGVQEEKKSRIVEIMVSSVSPQQLMMGKIIGIGLVGILQLLIWALLILVGAGVATHALGISLDPKLAAAASTEGWSAILSQLARLDYVGILISFLLYFVGGYLFFASILAAMSATVSSDEEAGQLMMPLVLLLVFSMYAGMAGAENPNGSLAFWTSMCPLTSPVVMMVRLPFGVPLWQLALSLSLLYASFVGTSYLGGRIYRTGILLYGKRPGLKELWRWLRYR